MNKFKVMAAVLLLCSLLIIGQSSAIRAKASESLPSVPAVVFVQDKNEKMMVSHSFENDERFYIPMGKDTDTGFYVTIPSDK